MGGSGNPATARRHHVTFRQLFQYGNIFSKRFEPIAIRLHDGNRHMAGLTGVDICHRAGFAFMRSANDIALVAVFKLAGS